MGHSAFFSKTALCLHDDTKLFLIGKLTNPLNGKAAVAAQYLSLFKWQRAIPRYTLYRLFDTKYGQFHSIAAASKRGQA